MEVEKKLRGRIQKRQKKASVAVKKGESKIQTNTKNETYVDIKTPPPSYQKRKAANKKVEASVNAKTDPNSILSTHQEICTMKTPSRPTGTLFLPDNKEISDLLSSFF